MTEPVTPQRLTSGAPGFVRRDHSGCRQPTEPRCWEHAMTALDLTAAEAETVARFDAAAEAEESLRERVARAMYDQRLPMSEWPWAPDPVREVFRTQADAAIAVMRGNHA